MCITSCKNVCDETRNDFHFNVACEYARSLHFFVWCLCVCASECYGANICSYSSLVFGNFHICFFTNSIRYPLFTLIFGPFHCRNEFNSMRGQLYFICNYVSEVIPLSNNENHSEMLESKTKHQNTAHCEHWLFLNALNVVILNGVNQYHLLVLTKCSNDYKCDGIRFSEMKQSATNRSLKMHSKLPTAERMLLHHHRTEQRSKTSQYSSSLSPSTSHRMCCKRKKIINTVKRWSMLTMYRPFHYLIACYLHHACVSTHTRASIYVRRFLLGVLAFVVTLVYSFLSVVQSRIHS